jgi:tRNA uridine 5-carboxymethylaminomethyl modification enzyme
MESLRTVRKTAATLSLSPSEARRQRIAVARDGGRRTASELLAYPGVSVPRLGGIWPELAAIEPEVAEQLEIDARYAGYLERQAADIAAFRRDEALLLPEGLDYHAVGGLSNEVRARLTAARPGTLGQAARMEGVTAGALTALLAHVRRPDETAMRSRA